MIADFIYEHRKGVLGTVIIHLILVLSFVFFTITNQIPKSEELGVLVNFGTDLTGFGELEPLGNGVILNEPVASVVLTGNEQKEDQKEEITLQNNNNESVALEKKNIEKKELKTIVPVEKNDQKNQIEKDESVNKNTQQTRSVDSRIIFPGMNPNGQQGTSEGITEGSGNQGNPNGVMGADNYDGNGKGTGGVGISFNLSGRLPLKLPKPIDNSQKSGIVVVKVVVDKQGKVKTATAGVKGSTTLDNELLRLAKEAAESAQFDVKSDAAPQQEGTITYHFKLQ